MKEHPIIFNGEMIKAILDGRKTQTRRVIKPQPNKDDLVGFSFFSGNNAIEMRNYPQGTSLIVKCPYGRPGDRLWVRETHVFEMYKDEPRSKDGRPIFHHEGDGSEWDEPYWLYPHYRATDPTPELFYEEDEYADGEPFCKWSPSIHMPRWASRIMLEVVKVKVERIQEMDWHDVIPEGIGGFTLARGVLSDTPPEPRWKFIEVWNLLNTKRGFGWDVNPWVWVIEFRLAEVKI